MHPFHHAARRSARRLRQVAFSIVTAATVAACADATPPSVVHAPRVLTAPVLSIDIEERIEVTGELQASLETILSAKVGGEITEVAIGEGVPVDKGVILLEIDPQRRELELASVRASLAQAQANLVQQRRQSERFRSLQDKGVASRSQLDEVDLQLALAEAQVAAAQAQLELAQQALDDASVRAPFAGLTGRRHVSLGQFVQVGAPLLELVALDPIEVVFHVAEIDSALVQLGQTVDVRVAPYPDETFRARVEVIFPTLDAESRTQRVKAVLGNPDGRLRPGLFARADLGIALRKGITVLPDEAILLRSEGPVIFRLRDDSTVERRNVELGAFRGEHVEVRSGVAAGDTVVTRGHMDLIDGARVEVVRAGREAGRAESPR